MEKVHNLAYFLLFIKSGAPALRVEPLILTRGPPSSVKPF